MVRVKICGITNKEDYDVAVAAGADLAGFIFIPGTPRAVARQTVKGILEAAERRIINVGLFQDADPEDVAETVEFCGLDAVQLQGEELPEQVQHLKSRLAADKKILKVFKVNERVVPIEGHYPRDYGDADFFVFDTYHPMLAGGTGERFDIACMEGSEKIAGKPFFIAGGLRPENVAEVVRASCPYGVDVSSGVEVRPGRKDAGKIRDFISNARKKSA